MFELKSYTRKELAMLYFPENKPRAAYINFMRWLQEQKKGRLLFNQLRGKRVFSKEAVKLIIAILGEP